VALCVYARARVCVCVCDRNVRMQATNAHLADPNDQKKQQALAQACKNMKDAVDEVCMCVRACLCLCAFECVTPHPAPRQVLGRVRPHPVLTDPSSVKVGAVKPADVDASCDDVVKVRTVRVYVVLMCARTS
jgi:hypothetical protein